MKKRLTALLLIFVLLLSMSGCAAANALEKIDAAEDLAEVKLDAAEDKLEAALREAVRPVPTAPAPTTPAPTAPTAVLQETLPAQAPSAAADSSQPLTREQAQQITLDHLGFTADQVTRLRTEYEIDDGIPMFDVAFYEGDWEYEFEIHAESGKILSYDRDHKYD